LCLSISSRSTNQGAKWREPTPYPILDVVDDVLQSQMSRNLYTHTHEFLNNECLFFLLVCSQVYIKANQPAPYSTVY
jgi:hypothetical protein